MTKIIAFVNTWRHWQNHPTICLSTALAGLRDVVVWDADPQGSATDWAEQAAEAGDPLPFAVEVVNEALLKRARRNTDVDYAIIDTPPGHPRIIDQAIAMADFVILPSSPAVIDLSRMLTTAASIPAEIPRAALLTRANKQTVAYKTAVEFLFESSEVPVFSHAIGDRQAIQIVLGRVLKSFMTTLPSRTSFWRLWNETPTFIGSVEKIRDKTAGHGSAWFAAECGADLPETRKPFECSH